MGEEEGGKRKEEKRPSCSFAAIAFIPFGGLHPLGVIGRRRGVLYVRKGNLSQIGERVGVIGLSI